MEELLQGLRYVASGVSIVGAIGSGVGIGVVFGCFLIALALNPHLHDLLFRYAIMGFALCESVLLFVLTICLVLLFM